MKHVKVETPQYVSFDQQTGTIMGIGPTPLEGFQKLQVTEEEVEPIKSLREKMTDYVVVYNRKEKQFKLKKIVVIKEGITYKKIDKVGKDKDFDIILNINSKKNVCNINTNEELLDIMKKSNIDLRKDVTFSITKKDDPHILYDIITFNITDKSEKPIKIESKYDVYTNSDMAECVYGEIK
jgi:hypothetical protein|tara:strand:- start:292 stop:834 length:543 start_codon:yes stop_codon:yes gene_type:complete